MLTRTDILQRYPSYVILVMTALACMLVSACQPSSAESSVLVLPDRTPRAAPSATNATATPTPAPNDCGRLLGCGAAAVSTATMPTPRPSLLTPQAPAPEPEPPRVTGAGVGINKQTASWAAVLENPGETAIAAEVEVILLTAAGAVTSSHLERVGYIGPGEKVALTGSKAFQGTAPAQVEVKWRAVRSLNTSFPPHQFAVQDQKVITRAQRSVASGVVTNASPYTIRRLRLVVVAYNAGGAMIGGGAGKVELLPATGKAAFEVNIQAPGTPARLEVYPSLDATSKIEG